MVSRPVSLLLVLLALSQASPPLCTDDAKSCVVETGGPATPPPPTPPPSELVVVAYNIDRNGHGGDGSREGGLEPIAQLLNSSYVPTWDVLLLTEVTRGCPDPQGQVVNGATVLAGANFYWAYGVEYVLSSSPDNECSIGNAIVSRYPLTNAATAFFAAQCEECMFSGRKGGRSYVHAAVQVGPARDVTVTAAHLESGKSVWDYAKAELTRGRQANEIPSNVGTGVAVIGGDFNDPLQDASPPLVALRLHGFVDAHSSLRPWDRDTCPDDPKAKYHLACFDYLTSRGASFGQPGICHAPACVGLSDHVPIWATLHL